MTPAQMLAKLQRAGPILACEDDEQPEMDALVSAIRLEAAVLVKDFAAGAGMTLHQCLDKRLCPVCGANVKMELDTERQEIEYFWCDKSNMHIFERDQETGEADRVQM